MSVRKKVKDFEQGAKRTESRGPETGFNVKGGDFTDAILGNVGKKIVKNIYNQGPIEPTLTLGEGDVSLASNIVLHEDKPINLDSRIFEGTFGSKVTGNKKIAIKILKDGGRERKEVMTHFSVPHYEHIVQRIHSDTFSYRGQPSIYIAMELCYHHNLYKYVKNLAQNNVPFDNNKFHSFAIQITKGLNFLHFYKIINRDLKPHNILLSEDCAVAKVSDFGLSKAITSGGDFTKQSAPNAGTDGWKSPEVLRGDRDISTSADIFPLGEIYYFLWSYGKHPYGPNPHSWNHYILHNENLNLDEMLIPNPAIAKDLIQSMLQQDPTQRPTTEQILKNPVFVAEGREVDLLAQSVKQIDLQDHASKLIMEKKFTVAGEIVEQLVLEQGEEFTKSLLLAAECDVMTKTYEQSCKTMNSLVRVLKSRLVSHTDISKMADECETDKKYIRAFILHYSAAKLVQSNLSENNAMACIADRVYNVYISVEELLKSNPDMKLIFINHIIPALHELTNDLSKVEESYHGERIEFHARCLCYIGHSYYMCDEKQQSIDTLESAIDLMKNELGSEAEKYEIFGSCFSWAGLVHEEMGNKRLAAEKYEAALIAYDKATDWEREGQKLERINAADGGLKRCK